MEYPLTLIILLPMLGALINALSGRFLHRRVVEAIACIAVWCAFVCSCLVLSTYRQPLTVELASWLSDFDFVAPITIYLDPLSLSLCLMITFVCGLIHVYATAYMAGDQGHVRFFALLNLFVAAMLLLVLAENLPLLYLGWEGVGLCSYALIGFWYREERNATAGRKAFIVTRIGDTALVIAIVLLFELCGTESIPALNRMAGSIPAGNITTLGLLMLIGAMGKSAQLPLSVWLPDAMAGPTPVSAQIHAATMVTAGVYLLMRMSPLIGSSPEVLSAIAITGGLTSLYGATCAVAQRDLKRVLAYSTISQIGYMIMGVGAGSLVAPTFHLLVHAFYKALLFLGAGCVITALHHEQDIYSMGGLRNTLPRTFWPFLAGSLCLAGFPLTGGFFSKDAILTAVWERGGTLYAVLFGMGLLTALLTAFYTFRMVYLVFGGESGIGDRQPVSSLMEWMLFPLAVLGIGAGLLNIPAYLGNGMLASFLGFAATTQLSHATELSLQALAALSALAGIGLARYRYGGKERAARLAEARQPPGTLQAFCLHGWYLDRLYDLLLVRPYKRMAQILWKGVDEGVIDAGLDRFARLLGQTGQRLGNLGEGRVSAYILSMAAGAALLIAYMAWVTI